MSNAHPSTGLQNSYKYHINYIYSTINNNKINIILDATLVPSYSFLNYFCYPCHSYWSLQKKFFKDLKLEYIPDKKETHHIELFNSQEDHKG